MPPTCDRTESAAQPSGVPVPCDRLSAIGARVARVGHECRVPLSLIAGSLDALQQYAVHVAHYVQASEARLANDSTLAQVYVEYDVGYAADNLPALVAICREGADRLRFVVTQLGSYVRGVTGDDTTEPVDVRQVLRETLSLMRIGRTGMPCVVADLPVLPAVAGSSKALGEAFTNLIANACDAAAEGPDPRVWVRASVDAGPTTSDYIEVSVRDNGRGIPAAQRAVIFEPFFSTKSRGAGLGLGLTIAREVIEHHGGTVALADDPVSGAEFVVRLPVRR